MCEKEPTSDPRLNIKWKLGYLGYLVFFLLGPYYGTASWPWTLFALVIFLPIYFWAYTLEGWEILWPIVIFCTLGAVYAPFNYGSSTFFVYAAALAPAVGSSQRAWGVLVGVMAAIAVTSLTFQPFPYFWIPATLCAFMVGAATITARQVATTNERLRLSQDEVSRLARVAERERIARDLHDVLGHTLSAITVKSQLAARLADRDPVKAAEEIRDVERISRQALKEVRSAVAGYRAENLAGEIDNARGVLAAAGVELECLTEPPRLEPVQEGVLALALREAVTNILRHAEASHCRIRFTADGGDVRLEVEDDGAGSSQPEGMGLSGMRERVASLGGHLERYTDSGTHLIVTLPVTAS